MSIYERKNFIMQKLAKNKYFYKSDYFQEFEKSESTFKRDLQQLKRNDNYVIEYNPSNKRYEINKEKSKLQLPGIWLSSEECHSLVVLSNIVEGSFPELEESKLKGFIRSVENIVKENGVNPKIFKEKIKYKAFEKRKQNPEYFSLVLNALIGEKKFEFNYLSRQSKQDEVKTRTVSPLQMITYRNSWYLIGYCHQNNELRTFAVELISQVEIKTEGIRQVRNKDLESYLSEGFGIYCGEANKNAKLKFTPRAAQWIKHETWYAEQNTREENGYLILEFPYVSHQELVMEILRYSPEVEVLEPVELRTEVVNKLKKAIKIY
ncbi:MAG: WYL domain-containing protein [Deltaproteobacteria bacterium]|jgi:predicted DNA-binding transcriptional regulator YafY|nr:WYL domain-containing protein [Deltaproteobacteria bacterium]